MRIRHSAPLALVALLTILAISGCGTHGAVPPLGADAHAVLGSIGTATLTPTHAIRVTAYYKGHQLPVTGAQTPALLRDGSCFGPAVAALTDGVSPAINGTPAPTPAPSRHDDNGATEVAVQPGAQWNVVVYDRANDPKAQMVACGHPISDHQQYFDLYTAAEGSNGIALGTALISPIVMTHVDVSLTSEQVVSGGATWAVREGSCTGTILAEGTIPAGAVSGSGIAYADFAGATWYADITPAGKTSALCAQFTR